MIHDLSERSWGRNYAISEISEDGLKLVAAIWATPMPAVGDHLIIKGNQTDTTCYRIETLERCDDPRDMAFVDLVFAPRDENGVPAAKETTDGGS